MAHGLGRYDWMFTTKEPAWHGVRTIVADASASEEAIRIAKLDWTAPVVINFYVLKYCCPYLFFRVPPFQNVRFPFERFEKTLGACIIPAVSLPAHALAG
ncbi:hypothetical protein AGMMS49579_12640 [Spirochaetia bacterium]|nr:hypothetical protein AGMMS49579_12640 [Spirochaetia bacterium]